MASPTRDIKDMLPGWIVGIAQDYEMRPYDGESAGDFRSRLAQAYFLRTQDTSTTSEIIIGKHAADFTAQDNELDTRIMYLLGAGIQKKLEEKGDICVNTSYRDMETIVSCAGFKKIFCRNYGERDNEFAVWISKEYGMVLLSESSTLIERSVNSAYAFCELSLAGDWLKMDGLENSMVSMAITDCGSSPNHDNEDGIRSLSLDYDCRHGLYAFLDRLNRSGLKTCPTWKYPNGFMEIVFHGHYSDMPEEARRELEEITGYAPRL